MVMKTSLLPLVVGKLSMDEKITRAGTVNEESAPRKSLKCKTSNWKEEETFFIFLLFGMNKRN